MKKVRLEIYGYEWQCPSCGVVNSIRYNEGIVKCDSCKKQYEVQDDIKK